MLEVEIIMIYGARCQGRCHRMHGGLGDNYELLVSVFCHAGLTWDECMLNLWSVRSKEA